jgi:Holliday junction resolvase RusA-like endonuclease
MTVIEFACPLPPRGLRTRSRTQHTGYRSKLVREYQEEVWIAGHQQQAVSVRPPWAKARLRLTWCYASNPPDADNALASLKHLIDVLHTKSKRPLGIIVDDRADCLTIERVELEKVAHRHEERILVRIEKL